MMENWDTEDVECQEETIILSEAEEAEMRKLENQWGYFEVPNKKCLYCGNSFVGRRGNAKYCSQHCYNVYHVKQEKERKKQKAIELMVS